MTISDQRWGLQAVQNAQAPLISWSQQLVPERRFAYKLLRSSTMRSVKLYKDMNSYDQRSPPSCTLLRQFSVAASLQYRDGHEVLLDSFTLTQCGSFVTIRAAHVL